METIPKKIIDGLSLKLPANIKGLLNTRSLDIYDVIQLLVNTTNKSNMSIKQTLEILNEWLENKNAEIEAFKNSVMNYIKTGEFSTDGIIASSSAFSQSFWGEISSKMVKNISMLKPNATGNNYGDGSKWVFRFEMYDNSVKWIDASELSTNLQFDLDTVRGLVVTDNNNEFEEIGVIPFASLQQGGMMSRIDKSKLDNIRWDSDRGLLFIDNVAFQLTPYQDEPVRTYYAPTISEISYADIPNSGGVVRPVVHIEQQVRIAGGVQTMKVIHATYEYDPTTGQMKTTYANGDYMKDDGALQMTFLFSNVAQGVLTSTNGAVTKQSASAVAERVLLANVTASATMNGIAVESSENVSVYQSAAVTEYEYQEPEITSFTYNDISRNGGNARPTVVVNQQVIVTTGSRTETKTITATYQWNASRNQMETTYVNGSYMKQNGLLAPTFEFGELAQGVTTSSSGIVTKISASAIASRQKVASATVSVVMNGEQSETSLFADIYQQAAQEDRTVFYGTEDNSLPTSLGSNSFALQSGTNIIYNNESYGHYQWVAVPSSLNATVTILDTDGDEVAETDQGTSSTQISGYNLYYWHSYGTSDGARFRITI